MIYEYWLAGIKEITDLKKQKLREVYGSGKAIYYIEETKLDKLRFLNEKDVAILKNAKKETEENQKSVVIACGSLSYLGDVIQIVETWDKA